MTTSLRLQTLALSATIAIAACSPPTSSNNDSSVDAATSADSGVTNDATSPSDSGVASDSGAAVDSGTMVDSGIADDSSMPADASSLPDAAQDASTPDSGAPCNTLAFEPMAPAVPFSTVGGSVPVLNGGTILDGTYYTASAMSSGAMGTIRAVWRVNGTTLETLEETTGLTGTDAIAAGTRARFTISTSGSNVTFTATCGARATYTTRYLATSTMLTVMLAGGRVNFRGPTM